MSILALLSLVEAVKHEDSTVVTAIATIEIVLDYLAQVFLVGTSTDAVSLTGAVVTTLSIVAVTLEPGRRAQEEYEEKK